MLIKDKLLKNVIIGSAFLWIGIGIWGVHECLETARLFKRNERALSGDAFNRDAAPYLFSHGLAVPYIVFATAIASSVFVLFTLYMVDSRQKRRP
jgi:hypothetical protein